MSNARRSGGQSSLSQGGRQVGGAQRGGPAGRRRARLPPGGLMTLLSSGSIITLQSPAPRSASPFLMALEGRAAAGRPPAAAPATAAAALHSSSMHDAGCRTQAAARRHHQVSTAARLQALIARANRIASGSSGDRGVSGSAPARRPASALQQRRPPVLTDGQRAASAMALREQLHAEERQHGAGTAAPSTNHAQQRAGSRLGRLPRVPLPQAAASAKLRSGTTFAAVVPAAAGVVAAPRAGPGVAEGRLTPPPRPGSAAASRQPPAPQQLPALALGRPPSRMQHYNATPQHRNTPATAPSSGASSQTLQQQQQQQQRRQQQQAMASLRPPSAAPKAVAVPLRRSVSLGSGGGSSASGTAAADVAELLAVTREACSHSVVHQRAAALEQQALQLVQQLAQACEPGELQAAADSATSWLAAQLPQPAAQLLTQLAAVLLAAGSSSSAAAGSPPQPAVRPSGPATPGLPSSALAGSLRPHLLFQQCVQLRAEKAALERLNGELSSQVGRAHALHAGHVLLMSMAAQATDCTKVARGCLHSKQCPHSINSCPPCLCATGCGVSGPAGQPAPPRGQPAARAAPPAGGGGGAGKRGVPMRSRHSLARQKLAQPCHVCDWNISS